MEIVVNLMIVVLVAAAFILIYKLGKSNGHLNGMQEVRELDQELFIKYDMLIKRQDKHIRELTDEVERLESEHTRTA